MNEYYLYFIIVICVYNLYVNIRLLISSSFERIQKIVQSIMIWLLPVIGASIVLYFLNDSDQDPPTKPNNQNYANDSMPSGVQ